MYEGDQVIECAFLIGAYCRANPQKPFAVGGDLHDRLKIVGCQSWQRYLDYHERRKRFGNEAVEGSTEGRTASTSESTQPGSSSMAKRACEGPVPREHPLSELPLTEMGRGRGSPCIERRHDETVPMPVLQAGNDGKGTETDHRPAGSYLNGVSCCICKEQATVTDMGLPYCDKCGRKLGLIK